MAAMNTLLDLLATFPERGEHTAIVYRTGVRRFTYSYAWLYSQALRCATWFGQQGVGSGDRVVLWAPNSPWWAVAWWGALVRGAQVVPVDFASNRERAERIAELTSAKLMLQSAFKVERAQRPGTVTIETLEYALAAVPLAPKLALAQPTDVAELIYTSGTTGDPKGVALTHGNIMANVVHVNEVISIGEGWAFLSVLPLSHMFEQVGGLLTPFYRGGSIVYLRTVKPLAIRQAFQHEGIATVMLVPRLLQLLKNGIERELAGAHLTTVFRGLLAMCSGWPSGLRQVVWWPVRRGFGSGFKFFVSGGAPLELELMRFWQTLGFTIVEGYGLTECSPILTVNQSERAYPGSVGAAIPGVELQVQAGEIQARGESVFAGYYNNPQATAQAFTPDGWFKTGDLGTIDPSGHVYLKGRSKEVVVTGAGLNVYPDDIEPVLNKLPGVREGCVVGLNRGQGEEVHAVLILDGSGRKPEAIITELNAKLDSVQQVTGFTVWPEVDFPKTTTLKVQKFKVHEWLERGVSAGVGGAQDKLVSLVSRVVGKPPGEVREDSLLVADLGLTSIARLELVNYLEQEWRLDLDDSAITPATTVAELRRLVRDRRHVHVQARLRPWTNSAWVRAVRKSADRLWHYRLLRRYVTLEVRGRAHLEHLSGPVLFVSNHTSYLDGFAIWFALPPRYRYYLATAAGDEFFFQPGGGWQAKLLRRFMYEYLSFFGNAFILPEKFGFRHAVEFMGTLVDKGVSVLYFPEGGLARPGKVLPYQLGIGLIVQELKVPVVPIKLAGLAAIIAPDSAKLNRGTALVTFGQPLLFTTEQPGEIVQRLQQAIEAL